MNCMLCHEGLATVPIYLAGNKIDWWCGHCFIRYQCGCPDCARNPCVCFEGETSADRLSQSYQRAFERGNDDE